MSLQEICPVKGNALSGECFPTKFLFPYSTNKTKVLSFFFSLCRTAAFPFITMASCPDKKSKALYLLSPPLLMLVVNTPRWNTISNF